MCKSTFLYQINSINAGNSPGKVGLPARRTSRNQNRGFVLPFVLGILSIMTLLILSQYQSIISQRKIHHVQKVQFSNRQWLLMAAKMLIHNKDQIKSCCLTNLHEADKILAAMQRSTRCQLTVQNRKIHYIIERLAQESCVQVKTGLATAHYQYWLKLANSPIYLRIHDVVLAGKSDCPPDKIRLILPGAQSLNFASL